MFCIYIHDIRNKNRQIVTQQKFENKCRNKHEVQIKLWKVQTCATDLACYSLTQRQFWQLTLKWLSGARAQDKNKQYYYWFLFFLFLLNYAIQGKSINAEFPRQVMNFPIAWTARKEDKYPLRPHNNIWTIFLLYWYLLIDHSYASFHTF